MPFSQDSRPSQLPSPSHSPREPLAHGRFRSRPSWAARPAYRPVDEAGIPLPFEAAPAPQSAAPALRKRLTLEPRDPVSRPVYPPRPVTAASLPEDGSLTLLSPSQRAHWRRLL